MTTIHRSVFYSVADKYSGQILAILSTAIMARLLTPAETGLFMVANALILLADSFRQFGVPSYIVQAPRLGVEAVRSAFTLLAILSAALALVFFLSARALASFYGDAGVAPLLRISILGFLILPFAAVISALLQREMNFRALAIINISGAFANFIVTISLGLAGFGPASYIWGFVAGSLALALTAFAARPEPWIFRPCLSETRHLISFGGISSAMSLLNIAYELLPRLAFGKLLGFDAVGIYGRAVTLCQLPDRAIVSAVHPVVLPAMAARVRSGGDLKAAYLRGFSLMSAVQWPALISLALLADPMVHALLGAQWGAVPPLVRALALASTFLAPAFMTYPVLVAVGRIRDTLYASLISIPPSILIMIGAAQFGLMPVALSMFIVAPLQMLVAFCFVRRAIGLTVGEMLSTARASLTPTLGATAGPGLIVLLSPNGFDLSLLETMVAIATGLTGWLLALRLTRHPIGVELLTVWHMLAPLLARWRAGALAPR